MKKKKEKKIIWSRLSVYNDNNERIDFSISIEKNILLTQEKRGIHGHVFYNVL